MIPHEKPDLEILQQINRYIMENHKDYNFKVDNGLKETALLILDNGSSLHGPFDESDLNEGSLFVPDLLDMYNKRIIEYEEESKPMKGPKIIKRGHFEESKRDSNRDYYYQLANFKVCKIWQSEIKNNIWKHKIDTFLAN